MKDDLKLLGLVPLFGVVGAFSTAAMWRVFAATLMDSVPGEFAVLACIVAGLVGPLAAWALVLLATRSSGAPQLRPLRRPAGIGFGLVLATEIGFYVPLGFFAVAFH